MLRRLCTLRLRTVCTRSHATQAGAQSVPRKAIVTAALNGVFTDPKQFDIPVTPAEMAQAAWEAAEAGATIVHIHFRDQRPGMGHLPSWDPVVAQDVVAAIRQRCPALLINMTTGTLGEKGPLGGGPLGPTAGPISCMDACAPELAALNAGSLNYLRTKKSGEWAWSPLLFANPVEKVATMFAAMAERGITPECECFDTGIVRSVAMYKQNGMLRGVGGGERWSDRWFVLTQSAFPSSHTLCPW